MVLTSFRRDYTTAVKNAIRRTDTHTHYRRITDLFYKTPQLHEQELRTALATLSIGERFVRDRDGVRRERVRPVRPPWLRQISDASTRALIERLRRQPIYQPGQPPEPSRTHEALPDAAARLRSQSHT